MNWVFVSFVKYEFENKYSFVIIRFLVYMPEGFVQNIKFYHYVIEITL